jgi:predicted O-linked N-acetylglucosamine transferase (SPINDLY family)
MNDLPNSEVIIRQIDQLVSDGKESEAEVRCREILSGSARWGEVRIRLAAILAAKNSLEEAESQLRSALEREPAIVAACRDWSDSRRAALDLLWSRVGKSLCETGNWEAAVSALQQAVAAGPSDAAAWNNLASAEVQCGRTLQARATIERAQQLLPNHLGIAANYAYILCRLGQRDSASQWLEQRVVLNSDSASQWAQLASIWCSMAQWDLAVAACRRALSLSPNDSAARQILAHILRSQSSISAAADLLYETVVTHPVPGAAWSLYADLYGGLLLLQGRAEEGVAYLKRAVELTPSPERHSGYLLALHYTSVSPEQLLSAHRQWDQTYARALKPTAPVHARQQPANRALRVGFVSGDVGKSPVSYLVLPGIEHLNRERTSLVWYSDVETEDEYTARIRRASSTYRNTNNLSDTELAGQITDDQIDLLIDLMGHGGKRMLVFARRPAPLQLSWLGYPGTTGLQEMDYLVADEFHVRRGEEPWFSEAIARMPHDYICFRPAEDAPPIGPLPALANGYVTFGCFNNPAKYSDRLIGAWTEILVRAPRTRLLLKFTGLEDPKIQGQMRRRLRLLDKDADRIQFEGRSPHRELLDAYNRVDLALDTQPYSGGLTTCESLWMGVPVITLPGHTLAGRHSTSHLTNAGFRQFIAENWNEYVSIAVEWSIRIDELARIRAQMREQLLKSPLCDARKFANDFQELIEEAWRTNFSK